jgi:hypothetical protein
MLYRENALVTAVIVVVIVMVMSPVGMVIAPVAKVPSPVAAVPSCCQTQIHQAESNHESKYLTNERYSCDQTGRSLLACVHLTLPVGALAPVARLSTAAAALAMHGR